MQQSQAYPPPLPRQSQATGASSAPDRCPFLGIAADPGTSLEFPSDAHQCHSTRLQVPISTIHQENYCLSPHYEACPVYRQHPADVPGGSLLPLSAVAVAGAAKAVAAPTVAAVEAQPSPWVPVSAPATTAAAAVGGAALGSAALGSAALGSAPAMPAPALPPPSRSALDWNQPAHPDFAADIAAETARRRTRRVDGRPVVIGLLLLLLIPLVWWLWTTVRPGARGTANPIGGSVVTLPTLAATAEVPPTDNAAIAAAASPTPAAGVAGQPEATATERPAATATATDLENIAATATALFAAATPATECVAPAWWVAYTIEAGDTLESLAAARGVLPEALIVANCLAGPDLPAGLVIALPPVGVIVALPGQATATTTRPAVTPTRRVPALPTAPIFFLPTPTFPVVIILPTPLPIFVPTDEPATRPPTRQPTRPPVQPTMTPVNPTATIPFIFPTTTPPVIFTPGATQTPPGRPTQTPPAPGLTATPTPTGTAGVATQTPPAP